ncbi:MAG: lytic transglycosylase domain-containing protein [Myxococcaceae bacterium]|nr:lytic transglycosylase domain-containing protein [Myxococcaceae bacterium]MBH2005979.1 lytic transglycosylase domain-containing protein [Myxococcaceae bacterium]
MNAIKNRLVNKFQVGAGLVFGVCSIPAHFWDQEVLNLPVKNQTELVKNISSSSQDRERREKLASLLVEQNPKRVLVELPETRAARQIGVLGLSTEERIQRARIQSQFNQNAEVLETLQPVENADLNCEVSYLKSLSFRRMRRYSEAREQLKKALSICTGETLKKAHYLKARLAAMHSSEESLIVLENFLSKYPTDVLTDDVMLWKAHVFMDLNQTASAQKALSEIIERFPQGDMSVQAQFERAFNAIQWGDRAEGLKLLEKQSTPQARYWFGRLLLYPDLNSYQGEKAALGEPEKGRQVLQNLAHDFPTNLYGYLAAQHLKELSVSKPLKSAIPKSKTLTENPTYQIFRCLKRKKQDSEAVWVLDRLVKENPSEADRIVLAKEYLDLKKPEKAHQLMRRAGLAFPRFPTNKKSFFYELAFPDAFPELYQSASLRNALPSELIRGLSREESQFDAQIVSWAGAVGLCQLMPQTARKSSIELLNPLVNIDTAAEHLRALFDDLQHPILVIAAYNAGADSVKRWLKKMPNEVPVDFFIEQIPYQETRNYVKKVTEAWFTYRWLNRDLELGLLGEKPLIKSLSSGTKVSVAPSSKG